MLNLRQLLRSTVAGVLCVGMLSVNAFAAETKTEEIREITYDQALEMVKKNNVTMEDLAEKITYLQDNKSDMFISGGGGNEPTPGDQLEVIDGSRMKFISTIHSFTNEIEMSKLNKEVTEISMGAAVKQFFGEINNTISALELAEQNSKIAIQLLNQGQLKADLGYLSPMDYEQLRKDTDLAKRNVELTKLKLENTYTEFNKLLGLKPEERYILVNELEFTPISISTDINDYARRKVSSDQGLRMQELGVDSAKFQAKFIADSTTVSDYRTREFNYEAASRSYGEAKKQKSVNIQSAYIQLQQMEKTRETLEQSLETAKTELEKAKVNLEVGNITQLTYDQALLAITKAENALQENLYTHDLLKYTFDNTCILGATGGAQQ